MNNHSNDSGNSVVNQKKQNDLLQSLGKCKTFAKRGKAIADDAVSLLKRVVSTTSQKLQNEIDDLQKSDFNDNSTTKSLVSQLSSIRTNFEILPYRLTENIQSLSKNVFSITLFGRTMTGKSTLMEVLTHGKGDSIGKGAQRTTRDVRSYTYKDLQITDVPGIAAFEGKEDENVAFEAAKKCDLVLFLITDDAPQASEAECLNRILELGKPVICLINVKADININTNIKMFKRDIEKKLNHKRLEAIKQQFLAYGNQYGQNWTTIRFAYVHLKSAFLSQQETFRDSCDELYKLSCFSYVDDLIINEVRKNGCFYKLKAFSDTVIVPIVDVFETLFNQSAKNSEQGSILITKRRKLKQWTEQFETDGKRRIEELLAFLSHRLKTEIASFAEDHYDNPNASYEWSNILKNWQIEERAIALCEQFVNDCNEELNEITREVKKEIEFSHISYSDHSINMPVFFDTKRAWNWTTSLLSSGLITISLFNIWNPAGMCGILVGLLGFLVGNFFLSDREDRIRDARRKLEAKLSNHIDKMIVELRKNMLNFLYDNLLKAQLRPACRSIDSTINSVFALSKAQHEFAISLNDKLQEINLVVIKEALAYLGYAGSFIQSNPRSFISSALAYLRCDKNESLITSVRRIPGYAVMLLLEKGKVFPNDVRRKLENLLKEKVWYIINNGYLKSMLLQAIWCKADRDSVDTQNIRIQYIDDIPRIAHIPFLDEVDANTKSRIRMAQQITGLLIMK